MPPLGWAALGGGGGQDCGEDVEVDFGAKRAGEEVTVRLRLLEEATVLFVQVQGRGEKGIESE